MRSSRKRFLRRVMYEFFLILLEKGERNRVIVFRFFIVFFNIGLVVW